jgi:PAS domain S-box-containing protein
MTPRSDELNGWIRSNLFDAVPMAVSVISRNYRILEANRAFEESFGPWEGRPCYEVYKGRSDPCLRCGALETFVDGETRDRQEVGVTETGEEIDYLVHIVPMVRPNGDIPAVIEMSTDITAVKQLEEQKREAERLAAVGETVAGIAHGIKNVLMGLEGGMYAVNTGIEKGDDARIARGWTTLEENVRRISEFVKEFLDFAKGRETEKAVTDPNKPAREVADLFREKAAQAGVRLETQLEADRPVPLDEEGIHTCLANLVSNAIDACLVADRDEPEFVVTLSSRDENGSTIYEVADNGRGMDYEISRKVFSKFFTTKGSDRGTGLGLLTTKRIVHQHGGRIDFTTEEGAGSVFQISLPHDPDAAAAAGQAVRAGSMGNGKTKPVAPTKEE